MASGATALSDFERNCMQEYVKVISPSITYAEAAKQCKIFFETINLALLQPHCTLLIGEGPAIFCSIWSTKMEDLAKLANFSLNAIRAEAACPPLKDKWDQILDDAAARAVGAVEREQVAAVPPEAPEAHEPVEAVPGRGRRQQQRDEGARGRVPRRGERALAVLGFQNLVAAPRERPPEPHARRPFVVDEQQERFLAGDFLIRAVLGADRSSGAIAVGTPVEVGLFRWLIK